MQKGLGYGSLYGFSLVPKEEEGTPSPPADQSPVIGIQDAKNTQGFLQKMGAEVGTIGKNTTTGFSPTEANSLLKINKAKTVPADQVQPQTFMDKEMLDQLSSSFCLFMKGIGLAGGRGLLT